MRVRFHTIKITRLFLILAGVIALVTWSGFEYLAGQDYLPALAGAGSRTTMAEIKPPAVATQGLPAPDFNLQDVMGNPVSLSQYRGRPVLLYFWATWCPYCRDSIPRLVEIKNAHADSGLEILAIDILESPPKVRDYLQSIDPPFPVLLDQDGSVSNTYLIRATPSYVFIDRDGVYRDLLIGSPRLGAIEGRLHPLLEKPDTDSE